MRVLHLDAGREMRGGQWQVLRLIEGLAAKGVESTLLARPDAPLFAAARERGWRVEPLGIARALRCLRGHDVIHAHDARSHSLGVLLGGLAGAFAGALLGGLSGAFRGGHTGGLAGAFRGTSPGGRTGAFAGTRPLVVSRRVAFPVRSRWKYGRARQYLAVSAFVKQVLIAGGVPEEKIAVVYDGVPLLEISRGAAVLGIEKDSALLPSMGLKMAANLEEEISSAAILVYITGCEGLGSGVLLAMSAAVPVIASNIGGLPEVIRHGENGLLVENDAAAISSAIRTLLDHPEQARQLGAAARRTVIERFTVDRMVAGTLDAYLRVLS